MHAKVGDYLWVKGTPRNGMINMLIIEAAPADGSPPYGALAGKLARDNGTRVGRRHATEHAEAESALPRAGHAAT